MRNQIMEEVASDNRAHMAAIGKEYQEMVNQLVTVGAGYGKCSQCENKEKKNEFATRN